PAKDARTIVEFKKRYKHLLVQGHYFKGLLAGSAYLYRKLFHKGDHGYSLHWHRTPQL
ncbi:hypothetical protein MJI47_30310, partial [Salmonella enterica subsp. enterica serovar Kentucky]|nr:hypothetical protein [Salmonella enterica subsp. enterica serovar Kentucky]